MKKLVCLLPVLCFGLSFAQNWKWRNIKLKDADCDIEVKEGDIDETEFDKHYKIIRLFYDSCTTLKYQQQKLHKPQKTVKKDTLSAWVESKKSSYRFSNGLMKNVSATVGSDGIISSFYFPFQSRKFTREEQMYYTPDHKIPPTYKNIYEEDALEIAHNVKRFIYGKEEADKFDSVTITESVTVYSITFKVKPINDIIDSRSIDVSINANSGHIISVHAEGLRTIDYSYVPKITKEEALQMYTAVADSLHATIKINKIGLQKHRKRDVGPERWAWKIYGHREDKQLSLAAMMFIDSETGEVIFMNMD